MSDCLIDKSAIELINKAKELLEKEEANKKCSERTIAIDKLKQALLWLGRIK